MKLYLFLLVTNFLFINVTCFAEVYNTNNKMQLNDFNKDNEITANQYCMFLNAVASQEDLDQLYNEKMGSDPQLACIERIVLRDRKGYIYTVISGEGDLPVSYINLYNAERFCNWLENNSPTKEQRAEIIAASTEGGSYCFNQEGDVEVTTPCSEADYYVPEENNDDPFIASKSVTFSIAKRAAVANEESLLSKEEDLFLESRGTISNSSNTAQVIWGFIRDLIGCGMCQLLFLKSLLLACCAAVGIKNSPMIENITGYIEELQMAEIPYVPGWLIYRLVPVAVDLGILLILAGLIYGAFYYGPAILNNCEQFFYMIGNMF